ncbi:transmembrane protein 128 [Bombina bombina]|uniref:transmembrane protein 128 n=1 Tax=Bombina bombina TaxID=8345 RepID=UPI00235A7029|nr:transmembrane protein 128 [Bombina bombina]
MASLLEDNELKGMRRRFQQQAEALLRESATGGSEFYDEEKKDSKPLPRINIHSVFWILAAISITYYTDFFQVVKEILLEGCWWLMIGTSLLGASVLIALYCIIYLEWRCGISDYDSQYPALVPFAVSTFVIAAICYNAALWPVWSLFTPLILFTQFMGMVMLVSLLG